MVVLQSTGVVTVIDEVAVMVLVGATGVLVVTRVAVTVLYVVPGGVVWRSFWHTAVASLASPGFSFTMGKHLSAHS